jgi:hypothetical protein
MEHVRRGCRIEIMKGTRQTWVPCFVFLTLIIFLLFSVFVCLFTGCSSATLTEQEARDTKKSKPEARDTKKTKPDTTSGRSTKVDHETQTEPNSRQRDYASVVKQGNVRRLEDENRKLSKLVEDYERKIAQLNIEMESILRDRTSHIQAIKMRYEEENQRQLLKMRDMRDELLWYK